MLIKNLNIKNYGAIKEADLEFQKGFNLISGANGNGKSHIIRALAYLLLNHTEAKIEDDCNWDADAFLISTLVEHNNKSFDIQNSYAEKGGARKKLIITDGNNQTQLDSNNDVTEALAEHFDPTYCKPAIVSFQGEMDIVSARPAERRDFLKKIYDLSFISEIEHLNTELESLKNEESELQKKIFALENKEYDIKELKNLPISEEQYQLHKKDYEELRQKKENIEMEIKLYEQIEKELTGNKMILGEHIAERARIEASIDDADRSLKDLLSDLQSLDEVDTLALEEKLAELKLKRIPSFSEAKLQEYRKTVQEGLRDWKNAKERFELASKGQCPTCMRDFTVENINELENEMNTMQQIYNNVAEEFEKLENKKFEYEKIVKENQEIEHKRKSIQQDIEYEKKLVEEKRNNLNSQIASVDNRKLFDTESLESTNKKIIELQQKIKESQNALPQMKPQLPDTIENDLIQLSTVIVLYEDIEKENKVILQNNIALKNQQKDDMKKIAKLQKESDAKTTEINNHDSAIKILKKDFPNYIINLMKSDLEKGMNELLDNAYKGRYNVQIKENRSGLIITYGKKNKDIRLASGAEKNIFNIGFKNSFNELAGLGVLILDEALNFADDDIAKSVFNAIKSRLEEEKLNQVFVITHKDSVKKLLISEYGAKTYEVDRGKISLLEN